MEKKNISQEVQLLCAYYVPGTVPSTLQFNDQFFMTSNIHGKMFGTTHINDNFTVLYFIVNTLRNCIWSIKANEG